MIFDSPLQPKLFCDDSIQCVHRAGAVEGLRSQILARRSWKSAEGRTGELWSLRSSICTFHKSHRLEQTVFQEGLQPNQNGSEVVCKES